MPVDNGQYNFRVATFDRVDGATMTLADISVDDNYSSSTLSFLNSSDASTRKFYIEDVGDVSGFVYYFEGDLIGTEYEGQPGWYYDGDGGLHPMNTVEVPYGSMFYIEGAEDCNVVASGVVLSGEEQPIEVVNGAYNFMGNVTPVDLTLADIGVDEDYSSSTLSFLNASDASTMKFHIDDVGDVSGFVYYFEGDLIGTEYEGQPGWYYDGDGGLHPMNSVSVPAGSMFYVEGAEDCKILIPPAI